MVQKVILSDSECILDLPEAFWGGLGKVDFLDIFDPSMVHFGSIFE